MLAKVFKMNEFDWVAANSKDDAIVFYRKTYPDEAIKNVFECDINKPRMITDEYNRKTRMTLRQLLEEEGQENPYVCMSTEW